MRLFIALPFSPGARESLVPVYKHLCEYRDTVKPVEPENYHLTLRFLGEPDNRTGQQIIEGFSNITIGTGPVPFSLGGLGYFSGKNGPSVFWAGIQSRGTAIYEIQKLIEHFTVSFGFEKEKKRFRPHITVARARKNMHVPGELIDFIRAGSETVYTSSTFTRVVLFSSELKPGGPVYTERGSVPL